jgi:archaeal flagellin FlaB
MVRINQRGAIGIGAMIIFIAMVLVAGIAAYILISTGNQLEMKSSTTGSQTIKEVATGLKITTIEAHNTSGKIDKILISITPRAGSPAIALDQTLVELTNMSIKCILKYNSSCWVNATAGVSNIFQASAFSTLGGDFGIIVIKDNDYSCSQTYPMLTRDDTVMLAINSSAVFNGIPENVNIQGNVITEEGAWGIIQFRTPSAFAQEVFMLQQD